MADAPTTLPAIPVDELAVRQIMADIDRLTTGRRRIDVAHACLNIVGTEIAANAPTAVVAKSRGMIVARQLKDFVRAKFAERQKRAGAT